MEDITDFIDKNNGYHSANGKFAPGNPGRPPGVRNKGRQALKAFMEEQVHNLPTWFQGLPGDRERLEYFTRLCAYTFPRLQSVALENEKGEGKAFVDYSALKPESLADVLANTTIAQ